MGSFAWPSSLRAVGVVPYGSGQGQETLENPSEYSRPRHCPSKTPARAERRAVELRRRHQLGPARLASRAGIPASTLHRVLQRHGVSRLSDRDRKSERIIRRIETSHPGELVHMDIKKQAKILPGGGWRTHGRKASSGQHHRTKTGYAFVHSAIDAHRRLAYSEVHANEQAVTMMAFWRRALTFSKGYGIVVERVDDRQRVVLSLEGLRQAVRRTIDPPHLHQALPTPDKWQGRAVQPNAAQQMGLRPALSVRSRQNVSVGQWLPMYNHHRHHTAIGGPPIGRVNNPVGPNI
jgi:hypothetical protein